MTPQMTFGGTTAKKNAAKAVKSYKASRIPAVFPTKPAQKIPVASKKGPYVKPLKAATKKRVR